MAEGIVVPETTTDTTASFQSIGGVHETNHRRDVCLVIARKGNEDKFTLTLQTNHPALQAELGSSSSYVLPLDKQQLWAAVQQCQSAWAPAVNHYLNDLRKPELPPDLLLELAKAGRKLFLDIFFPEGDEHLELRKVFSVFTEHLHRGELWLRVESSEFFAPWNLLYSKKVPLEPGPGLDPSGFWGYQHVIEHVPSDSGSQGFEPTANHGDAYRVSLQLDNNLDQQFSVPVTKPVISLLSSYSSAQLQQIPRPVKDDLAKALSGGPRNDHFMYFCCHAEAAGFTSAINIAPSWLYLTDGPAVRIEPGDIRLWLDEQMLDEHPIVFINACGGAQVNSTFYEGFGRMFLSRHASAVIGPQTEVPALFAGEFARCFFKDFFRGGYDNSLALVLFRLRRMMWDEYCNPLGLVYSLYRDADIFLPRPIEPATPPTQ